MIFKFDTEKLARELAEDYEFDEIKEVEWYDIILWVDELLVDLKYELENEIDRQLQEKNIRVIE